jgi:hypothetical protein
LKDSLPQAHSSSLAQVFIHDNVLYHTTLRNVGLAEMLRIIRDEEAPSLSRKLTSMGAAAADIAARRQTDPVSLRRLVDGDLNSITMKALEKTRERRYASVSDLAADIQRHFGNVSTEPSFL